MSNPIKYTSRTYMTVMNDLNSDQELASKPSWWKRIWAGVADVTSMWLNGVANNLSIRKAYTRGALEQLAQLVGFTYVKRSPARSTILFNVTNDTPLPLTVSKSNVTIAVDSTGYVCTSALDLVFLGGSIPITVVASQNFTSTIPLYTGQKVRVTDGALVAIGYYFIIDNGSNYSLATTLVNAQAGTKVTLLVSTGSYTVLDYSAKVAMSQQSSVPLFQIGISDGTQWQRFAISSTKVVTESIEVFVDDVEWVVYPTWFNALSTDQVFVAVRENENTFVEFGDGVFGLVPLSLSVIDCAYFETEGSLGNTLVVESVSYTGQVAEVETAIATEPFSGGSDDLSLEQIRRLTPASIKTNERFLLAEDAKVLISRYFPAVTTVGVEPNWDGPLTCRIQTLVAGGGEATATLRTEIKEFLEARSAMQTASVTMIDTVKVPTNVTITYSTLPNASPKVGDYLEVAYYLLLTERGQEYESYTNEQLAAIINPILGVSLVDDQDMAVLGGLREIIPVAEFDVDIYRSDIGSLMTVIPDLRYYTDNVTYPIVIAAGRISTNGTITLVEV